VSEEWSDSVVVLSGVLGPDLRWSVLVDGDRQNLSTMLHVYRGGDELIAGSGFGGPALYEDSLINEYRGRSEGLPWFAMARTAPIVDRVVATTDHGTEVILELTPPVEQFGSRFAAAALPEGEGPASVRVERDGVVLETARQWVPPPR
jgi:hypothetical protein